MQFLTGKATLPDTPGFHVVPTACGSGKSTDIAEIAEKKKSGGVLIIVPTKKEADEMGARIGRLGSVSMPDIEVLHCQNGPAIGKYRSVDRYNHLGSLKYVLPPCECRHAIHQPRERAAEYGRFAGGFHNGCPNGCTYCFLKLGPVFFCPTTSQGRD